MLRTSVSNASIQEGMEALGRAGTPEERILWMVDGKRIPIKYMIEKNVPERQVDWLVKHMERWTSLTCLTFEKQELPEKVRKYCTDNVPEAEMRSVMYFYLNKNGETQVGRSTLTNGRCVIVYIDDVEGRAVNSIPFGRGLGLMEFLYRSDVEKYISYNFEHISEILNVKSTMDYYFRCWGKAMASPLPFDYLSMMGWYSYRFGKPDTNPSIVTRDPYQQYMMDYRNFHALPASPLDATTINIAYKCIPEWESTCKASGKQIPKCKNFGYVSKDCTCLCLPVFTGTMCETQIEPNFPYPMQDGAFNYTITEGGIFDMGELLPIKVSDTFPEPHLFLIIKLEPKTELLPHISVHLPFEKVGKAMLDGWDQDGIMQNIGNWDCDWGIRMLWGTTSESDGRRRLACDCTSMVGLNETKANARVLAARDKKMTLTFTNRLGSFFNNPVLAVESTKFVLETRFRESPKKVLESAANSTLPGGGIGGGNRTSGGGGGGGNVTQAPLTSVTGAAMTAVAGAIPTAAIVGAVAALLLLCLLCLLLMKRRKKKKAKDLGEEEEEEDETGSDSDD